MSPWWSLYVRCIHRMPGGVIVGDSGGVPVAVFLRSMSYVTSIVRAQLLPIACWFWGFNHYMVAWPSPHQRPVLRCWWGWLTPRGADQRWRWPHWPGRGQSVAGGVERFPFKVAARPALLFFLLPPTNQSHEPLSLKTLSVSETLISSSSNPALHGVVYRDGQLEVSEQRMVVYTYIHIYIIIYIYLYIYIYIYIYI